MVKTLKDVGLFLAIIALILSIPNIEYISYPVGLLLGFFDGLENIFCMIGFSAGAVSKFSIVMYGLSGLFLFKMITSLLKSYIK